VKERTSEFTRLAVSQSRCQTNVSVIDDVLTSGVGAGEVVGVIGPQDADRGILAFVVAAEGARKTWLDSLDGSTRKCWCVVTANHSPADIQSFMFAHLAEIPFEDATTHLDKIRTLNETRVLRDATKFAANGAANEVERAFIAYAIVSQSSIVQEFLPVRAKASWTILGRSRDTSFALPIAGFTYDDISSIVGRRMVANQMPAQSQARLMRQLIDEARDWAAQERCSVWIVHHLRNKFACCRPSFVLSHRETADCRDLATKMDHCIVLGNRDDDGRSVLRCTKTSSQVKPQPRVVKLDWDSMRFIDFPNMDPNDLGKVESKRSAQINIDDETWKLIQNCVAMCKPPKPQRAVEVNRRKGKVTRPSLPESKNQRSITPARVEEE